MITIETNMIKVRIKLRKKQYNKFSGKWACMFNGQVEEFEARNIEFYTTSIDFALSQLNIGEIKNIKISWTTSYKII